MKNPMMSAWLSAANSMSGAARGQMMAEFSKAQTQMMQDWQRMWMESWMQIWGMGNKRGGPSSGKR